MIPENRLKKILNRDKFILLRKKVFGLWLVYKATLVEGLFLCLLVMLVPAWYAVRSDSNSAQLKSGFLLSDADSTLEGRLKMLDAATPLNLEFNAEVENFVNSFLARRGDEIPEIKTLADDYFPVIELFLSKYDLPLELKYLAILESGLNPNARSKSGAVGIWQFLYNTCDLVGLEVNSYIDERRDPWLSTDAACRYFEYLYRIFGNWDLAIAAFNCGPGEVQKAIERAGGKTSFGHIKSYLPEETANYLPAFIGLNSIFAEPERKNTDAENSETPPIRFDTLLIYRSMSFDAISRHTGIEINILEKLNPKYIKNYIPVSIQPAILVLPKKDVAKLIKNERELYAKANTAVSLEKIVSRKAEVKDSLCVIYTVQAGDFFHKLAMSFGCTAAEIKAWNAISTNELFPGQQLKIWLPNKNLPGGGIGY